MLRRLLVYLDLKQYLHEESLFRLIVIVCIMAGLITAIILGAAFIQRKLETYFSRKQQANAAKVEQSPQAALGAMDFQLFESVMRSGKILMILIVLYWGLSRILIDTPYDPFVKVIFTVLCIWEAIKFFIAFIPFNIDLYLRRHGATLKTSRSRSLLPIVKGLIWAIGLTFLLDNLGFHVSTIIAGLGIVGVAVGLAGQAILADFFSYIVILLDKPFRIGDHVVLSDGKAGDVEYMGPKTTHLRNLEDDLIVCANSEMTKGILINQGSIHERVVVENIGVDYNTTIKELKNISDILKEVVNSFPQCSFDRACLVSFGASNLNFQLLYLVSEQRGGIKDFMNTRSRVNIAILERFESEGISMAFPTEHVLLSNLDEEQQKQTTQKDSEPEKDKS